MAITTEQKVGLFFLAAIIVLGLMIELVEDWRPFEKQYDYRAYFNSSVGLRTGDPVRVAGVEMGKVKHIEIENGQVRVDFYLTQDNQVRSDTVARIRQTNLLGGVFLGLDFGSQDSAYLPKNGTVQTEEGTNIDQLITNFDRNQDKVLGPLGEVMDQGSESLIDAIHRLENIMIKIDEGEGTLGKLINNPRLFDEFTSMATQLNQLLVTIEDGDGSLSRLLKDPSLYENLNRSMNGLTDLITQIEAGEGTLGKFIKDDQFYQEATETLKNLREISSSINRGEGSLGKLYNDEQLYNNLNEMIVRINSIATKVDEGQGTIGRLINEDDLYREAKTTLHKVEKTVDGIGDTGPLSALGVVLGTLF